VAEAVEHIPSSASAGALTPNDLAELLGGFNAVTAKLEATHAQLRGEVRRLSDELRAANEALERSRRLASLGEMAAGIAHEIRNPLGSIRLYVRLLDEDLADRPEQRATVGKIAGAVGRLNEVVGDVLTFARELRLRPEGVGAGDLLDEAAGCCAERSGVAVVVEAASRAVELECDATLVHQALVNVVRNAIEAAGEDGRAGRVDLAARRATVGDGDDAEAFVVLSVRDDGPGIPAEVRERIFNPFFTTRAAGTGLGLAIVARIVDAHGGRVVVTNNAEAQASGTCGGQDARGATVELWLPGRARSVAPSAEIWVGPAGNAARPRSKDGAIA
jgi:signal transduction histidine kinase